MPVPRRKTTDGLASQTIPRAKGRNDRDDVADGESDACGAGHVGGIGDLLEVGLHGDGQREESMVDEIEAGGNPGVVDKGVPGEDQYQADIFEHQRLALADAADERADLRRENHVEDGVDQEQRR